MAAVDARELAAIFAGGAIGTTARAALAGWMPSSSTHWPTVTFAVNVVGLEAGAAHGPPPLARLPAGHR